MQLESEGNGFAYHVATALLTEAFLKCRLSASDWSLACEVSPYSGPSSHFSILITLSTKCNNSGRSKIAAAGNWFVESCSRCACLSVHLITSPHWMFARLCYIYTRQTHPSRTCYRYQLHRKHERHYSQKQNQCFPGSVRGTPAGSSKT